MRRPKLKSASKRMSCSKRFKIQKKVREHKRKVKKESKKGVGTRKPKRDLRIPNDAPFKEDILREAEQRKQLREELRKQQKLERQKEVAKRRDLNKTLEDKKEKPVKKKAEEKKKKVVVAKPKKPSIKNLTKSLCREVNKVIEAADVILEVLDARDPLGSRCVQAEQAVLQSPNKKLLLVLNKIDLVPREIVEKWLQFLSNQLPTIAFKCSTQVQEKSLKENPECIQGTTGTVCHRAVSLLKVLHSLCPPQSEPIKVGLIGFANAGKSSLINTLKQYKACNVGTSKGTTRIMQEVKIDNRIRIIDSPSLVVSPENSPVILCVRSAFQNDDVDHVGNLTKILKHCDKKQVMLRYNIADYRSPLEFLDLFAHKRGLLKKKGLADLEAAAKIFLGDWIGSKLPYYTRPPTSFKSHIDCKQTSAMMEAVNRKLLNGENKRNIRGVKNPGLSSSIGFHFSEMSNGIVDENEVKEQDQEPTDVESEEDEMEEDEAIGEEDEAIGEVDENETPEAVEEPAPRKKSIKAVSFDKPAAVEDDYDFNADFN
ncbi:guanine nucleotide-binding protein-like 3 [Bufo bufo]|uniref:guanine nucleotide-binding protein-like 3 n=1 Tax=Bufo bufo TaxID=8384 RepID=UPI001ABE884B|nr:guanine nucleotide-binding protein-like 3 [Bufo bufo]